MKKFLKLFLGRMLWVGLVLLLEVAFIILFFTLWYDFFASINEWFNIILNFLLTVVDVVVMIYVVNSKANTSYKIISYG